MKIIMRRAQQLPSVCYVNLFAHRLRIVFTFLFKKRKKKEDSINDVDAIRLL